MVVAASAISLSGCGKESYVTTSTIQGQTAPGHFTVPPKVDIVLAEDDTGSIKEAYGNIAYQLPLFLQDIESKGWDYHFLTMPLTSDRPVSQVTASRYDANWGTQWVSPFPGAQMNRLQNVYASVFRFPWDYNDFLSYEEAGGSMENAFENLRVGFQTRINSNTGFSRPDAMTVVLVIGNGDDTSMVNYCYRPDGLAVACETLGKPSCSSLSQYSSNPAQNNCGTKQLSLNFYKSQLQSTKPDPSLVKFYAAVAAYRTDNCLGGASYAGSRYQQMAAATGGQAYDVCSQPISSVLSSLSNHLQATKLAFRTRYLFINQDPNQDTIEIIKYPGGDRSHGVAIPRGATNGWTYAGLVNNVYAVDYPTPMNMASGYAIELHGTAKLVGDDTADVTFLPAGLQNSD